MIGPHTGLTFTSIKASHSEIDIKNLAISASEFTRQTLATDDGAIEFGTLGSGTPVLMLPGRGGSGIEQFLLLGRALAEAGFRAIALNPRGVGSSNGPLDNLSLRDLARDVAAVIDSLAEPAHVIGRALGNRVARCVAADYPDQVISTCLISAGGLFPPVAGAGNRMRSTLPITHTVWRKAGRAHELAARTTPIGEWWAGGTAPIMVIQGLNDHIAPPENGRALASEFPDRVRLHEIDHAGHLVLFEQPERVIPLIIAFLIEHDSDR
ncbi:MAG: pimeloyl-ACP methyl ester carboxylesterase [Gammaproteobacteria bacterium]|jgi:pimeloyl-ACP methyl ester carboxylesterase